MSEEMQDVEFTQFLRPHGRAVLEKISRPKDIATMANMVKRKGFQFEIEVLNSGMVSAEILKGEVSIAHKIGPNGPGIPKMIDDLVLEAFSFLKREGA